MQPSQIGLVYDQAIVHQKQCEYQKRICMNDCGEKVYGFDQINHEKVCKNRVETCEKCEIEYKPNCVDFEKHDCLKELIKAREKCEV